MAPFAVSEINKNVLLINQMAKHKPLPPAEELWENFEYAPLTGKLYWLTKSSAHVNIGTEAGYKNGEYRRMIYRSQSYYVHRIIWMWMTGIDPGEMDVDHKVDYVDGVFKSNCWSNLRLANDPQNGSNRKVNKNNKSGFKGVYQAGGKWKSQIKCNGIQYYLGSFNTPEEAHEVYCQKALELHGEFARFD